GLQRHRGYRVWPMALLAMLLKNGRNVLGERELWRCCGCLCSQANAGQNRSDRRTQRDKRHTKEPVFQHRFHIVFPRNKTGKCLLLLMSTLRTQKCQRREEVAAV